MLTPEPEALTCDICSIQQHVEMALEMDKDLESPCEAAMLGAMIFFAQHEATLLYGREPAGVWTCEEHHGLLSIMRSTIAETKKKACS